MERANAAVQKEQNAVQAAQAKVEKARTKLQTATDAVKEGERRLQQARALSEHEEGDETQQVPSDLVALAATSEQAEKLRALLAKLRDGLRKSARERSRSRSRSRQSVATSTTNDEFISKARPPCWTSASSTWKQRRRRQFPAHFHGTGGKQTLWATRNQWTIDIVS